MTTLDRKCLINARFGRLLSACMSLIALAGCGLLPVVTTGGATAPAAASGTPAPTLPPPQIVEVTLTPIPAPATTALPIPTQPTPLPDAVSPDIPPLRGSFDVYLSAPDDRGDQLLRWVSTVTGEKVTEITIRTDDGQAVRAGQFVYFLQPGTRIPQRANTAGAVQPVTFASPPPGTAYYQFLPSATGQFAAWIAVDAAGSYTISVAGTDGSNARPVSSAALQAGERITLLRVSNDGRRIFYDRRPAGLTHQTLFSGRYDLYVVDTDSRLVTQLPGEPACGEALLCDAHISADGAYLVRTLPADRFQQPVVVTNLVSSVVLAYFEPIPAPSGFITEVGYPYFTPGGELIYLDAYGPTGLETYRLQWANIVTGEQRMIAELGRDRHRPLGWAANGGRLLTTREPGLYDTWQINVEDGSMRQIAAMLFLGHIDEPPPAP